MLPILLLALIEYLNNNFQALKNYLLFILSFFFNPQIRQFADGGGGGGDGKK